MDDLSLQILSRLQLKPLFRFISRLKRKKKMTHFETSDEHQQSLSSAQTVASIEDILLQIFSHLRLKPLAQFKSVSKHWNSLISDLMKPHPNPAAVGLIVYPTEISRFCGCIVPFNKSDSPTFLPKPKNRILEFKIMHGCNGLLVYSLETPNNLRHFVLNPTTMQWKKLPGPMHPERILTMCLAFDPSKSPHYRVVCVTGWRVHHMLYRYRFQVYSSETGSWSYISIVAFRGFLDLENGVYWNGALHWIPIRSGQNSIYFDLDQMPRVFPSPPTQMYFDNLVYGNYFGESCGHLHFVGQVVTGGLRVYEMKTDYSEWFIKYSVRLSIPGLTGLRLYDLGLLCICALIRGAKDEDCFLVLWNKGRITRHNIFSREFEVLRDSPQKPCLGLRVPLPYIESACSV